MIEAENEIGLARLGLGSLLKQYQLAVPSNQRDYSWELKYVRTLYQDFAREIDGDDRLYFLGTVVTIPRADHVLEVVDGQQRLATTAILLSCIRDYLKDIEPELASSINSDFLTVYQRASRSFMPRLVLNLNDNDYFRSRINGEKAILSPGKISHRLIDDAFKEANEQVEKIVSKLDVKDHGDALNRWIDFIDLRASIILLRVPSAANAYRMFETLNDRGKRVSQSDLVKNYLFGQAGIRTPEVQQKWSLMRGSLESMEDEDITITFLRHSLSIIQGFVREPDVYEAVQRKVRGVQSAVSFSALLESLANTFVAMHNSDHERWNTYGLSTRKSLDVLNLFRISPMRPLILAISQNFDEKETERAFDFCVSLGVKLMITTGTRTGTVEEGLAGAGHKIQSGEVTNYRELLSCLKNITPSDGQFKAAFENATVTNAKLARYYLRSLERVIKNEPQPWHIPNDDPTVINIEHILPAKPEGNWPQFTDDEVKIFKNRIGNMTMLRSTENSGLRSAPFEEKKKVYSNCPYEVTKLAAQEDDWSTTAIVNRQKILSDFAIKAWPI